MVSIGKPVIHHTADTEICFNDGKTYWKARATLEIVIALHTMTGCYEIIVYHPDVDLEAARLYLDGRLLRTKLDTNEIEKRLADRQEALLRAKRTFSMTELTKEVIDGMMLSFIMSRLNIASLPTQGLFAMTLAPQTGDIANEQHQLDIVYDVKPEAVVPLEVVFLKKIKVT